MILNHFIQLNNMGMSYLFQYCNLSVDSFNVRLIFYFVFFKYFYCYFIASYNMSSLFYFTECSFSFSFSNNEPTNLFSFLIFFFFRIVFFIIIIIFMPLILRLFFLILIIFLYICFLNLNS